MNERTVFLGHGRTASKLIGAARKSNRISAEFWRGLIVSAFIAAVVIVNLSVGVVMIFGTSKPTMLSETTGPVRSIAVVTRPLLDGTFCRYTVFDNNTSNTITDKVEPCGVRGPRPSNRTSFKWGGG